MGDCKEVNVPSVNEDPIKCDHLHSTDCVILEEAVPCLQTGKGSTLTELFRRLCVNLSKTMVEVEAGDNVTVDESVLNNTTIYTVNAVTPPKYFFYEEVISDTEIINNAPAPGPSQYFFPVGYKTLTYQNTTSQDILVEVHVSYNVDTPVTPNLNKISLENQVDGAIVKTNTSNTDTIEYETLGNTDLEFYLWDTVSGSVVNESTTETVLTTPSGNTVKSVISNNRLPQNKSFFKVISLATNEIVSLKFKAKMGSNSRLLKAQILVKEI